MGKETNPRSMEKNSDANAKKKSPRTPIRKKEPEESCSKSSQEDFKIKKKRSKSSKCKDKSKSKRTDDEEWKFRKPKIEPGDPGSVVHTCDTCFKSFFNKTNLKSHLRVHETERKFHCDVCNKAMKSKYSVLEHKSLKHGDTNVKMDVFQCEDCKMSFKLKRSLNLHRKRFHDVGAALKFCCHLCDKVFQTQDSMKRHISSVHEKLRPFICPICLSGFARKDHLTRHSRRCILKVKEEVVIKEDEAEEDNPSPSPMSTKTTPSALVHHPASTSIFQEQKPCGNFQKEPTQPLDDSMEIDVEAISDDGNDLEEKEKEINVPIDIDPKSQSSVDLMEIKTSQEDYDENPIRIMDVENLRGKSPQQESDGDSIQFIDVVHVDVQDDDDFNPSENPLEVSRFWADIPDDDIVDVDDQDDDNSNSPGNPLEVSRFWADAPLHDDDIVNVQDDDDSSASENPLEVSRFWADAPLDDDDRSNNQDSQNKDTVEIKDPIVEDIVNNQEQDSDSIVLGSDNGSHYESIGSSILDSDDDDDMELSNPKTNPLDVSKFWSEPEIPAAPYDDDDDMEIDSISIRETASKSSPRGERPNRDLIGIEDDEKKKNKDNNFSSKSSSIFGFITRRFFNN